jgi:predicted nuclease of predicted toxin-antitoxin system
MADPPGGLRWLADECVSVKLVTSLRAAGHDVVYATEQYRSAKDRDLLALATQDKRLLLTEDRDFGELIFGRSASAASGVVFMRIADERAHLAWPRLEAAIERFGNTLFGRFLVVEETRFRSRMLGPE